MKKILALVLGLFPFCMAHAADQKIAVRFASAVGSEKFACGASYDGIGSTRSRIVPTDFRFFVSAVELIDARGKAVPVALDQDGVWQYKNLALLDFEDGSGPCRNGNAGLHREITGRVPKAHYRGLRFTLGVPFELNHGDPTIAPSPLNISSMLWSWQIGYRFVKIDMATSGQPREADLPAEKSIPEKLVAMERVIEQRKNGTPPPKMPPRAAGFSIHLGSTDCASASLTTAPAACGNPNRATVVFETFDPKKNIVVADLGALLQGTNVDVNDPDTAPGCMAAPNDGDCPAIMEGFGLPYGGRPAGAQRFFRVE